MKKNPQVYIDNILDCIHHISVYTSGLTKESFLKSDQVQDAVFRRLEIIGEAVSKLPEDLRQKHPEIPWRDIIGTRNRLIHEYLAVDMDLIWEIIVKHLPELRNKITEISGRLNL